MPKTDLKCLYPEGMQPTWRDASEFNDVLLTFWRLLEERPVQDALPILVAAVAQTLTNGMNSMRSVKEDLKLFATQVIAISPDCMTARKEAKHRTEFLEVSKALVRPMSLAQLHEALLVKHPELTAKTLLSVLTDMATSGLAGKPYQRWHVGDGLINWAG